MESFEFEEQRMRNDISKYRAKCVLLQLPEGLKPYSPGIAKIVEEEGALPIISADPCYGACDLPSNDLKSLEVDLIFHFGHSRMLDQDLIPTVYLRTKYSVNVDEIVKKSLSKLDNFEHIGLATTIQHVDVLESVRKILEEAGKKVFIGDSTGFEHPGQVLGCKYNAVRSISKKVDAFLFVGGGKFHALGVELATNKPTIVVDPYDGTVFTVDSEVKKILKQRWVSIEEARKANNFGILISLKIGQKRVELALKIKKKIESMNKKAFLLLAREILPETIMEFPTLDAYINTACPRLSLDDASKFRKPILTSNEFQVLSGEYSWETLLKKGLFAESI